MTTAKSTQSCGRGSAELTTSTATTPHALSCVIRTIFRRSTASASAPPMNDTRRMGTSSARLTRPTTRDDRVSSYAWYGIATYVIMLPANETPWPMNSSRNSRDSRSGLMSTASDVTRRRSVEEPPSSRGGTDSSGGSGVARVCGGTSSDTCGLWRLRRDERRTLCRPDKIDRFGQDLIRWPGWAPGLSD